MLIIPPVLHSQKKTHAVRKFLRHWLITPPIRSILFISLRGPTRIHPPSIPPQICCRSVILNFCVSFHLYISLSHSSSLTVQHKNQNKTKQTKIYLRQRALSFSLKAGNKFSRCIIPFAWSREPNNQSLSHSVELQKANLQETNNQTSPASGGGTQSSSPVTANTLTSSSSASNNSLASAIPLAQLLTKPGALNALSSLSALGGLTDLLGGLVNMGGNGNGGNNTGGNSGGQPIQTTGVHRQKTFAPRIRSPNANSSDSRKSDRNKFNPY